MNRKNKILVVAIVLMAVFCVTIGTLIFLEKNKRALLQEANTKLVKENEKNKLKTDLQYGKVLKVEGDQIEFLQIMNNGENLAENKHETKKIKITDETKISAYCSSVYAFENRKFSEENELTFSLPEVDPEDICDAPKELLAQKKGMATIQEKQGTATIIIFH